MTDVSILVAGETLVDCIPDEPGPPTAGTTFATNFGGAAANVAMVLERLGVVPALWTRIARDPFGDVLADRLAESAVPGEFVVRDADAKTTLAFVTHDERGESTFDFFRERAADARMRPGTVPDETLQDLAWVHVTATTISREPSRTAILDLVERAAECGCTVSIDPNARPELWRSDETFGAVFRGTLSNVDVVKAGRDDLAEAGFDVDCSPESLARDVATYGPHTVFLTLGPDGALAYGTGEGPFEGAVRHRGYEVDAVDATGAGDGFLAAAIASLTHGVADPERALAVANAVGAVSTTERGALAALSSRERVRSLCGDLPWE